MAFGVELESKQKVNSDLHGVKAWKFAEEAIAAASCQPGRPIVASPLTPCMPLMPRSAT